MKIIADIGGSRMRIALSGSQDSFEEPLILDTPAEPVLAVSAFTKVAHKLASGRTITGGVIGIAGLLSKDRQTLLRAPHLRKWEGKNVMEMFSQAINAPVRLENDVALGALGEAHYGAGIGASIIAYIAVGTGLNGARVAHGRLDETALGFEIGHQRMGAGADAPEWESLVSGAGLQQRYGKPSYEISDLVVREKCADDFAKGLYNIILNWSPERVVLGGTLFTKGFIPLERVKTTIHSVATALPELPDIRLAALDDRSALWGALVLARVGQASQIASSK